MNWAKGRNRKANVFRAFTLLELLAVIAILVVLAVLTVVSVSRIARDAKLASGINRVMSSLAMARAEAIRTNTPVLMSFRMVKDVNRPGEPARVEVTISRFTGEVRKGTDFGYNGNAFAERFAPAAEIAPQLLPDGIKVACPYTDFGLVANNEETWCMMTAGPWSPIDFDGDGRIDYYTSSDRGEAIGLLFGADGALVTRNGSSISTDGLWVNKWVDYDGDGNLERAQQPATNNPNNAFFIQNDTIDEVFCNMAQFLVVYDEERALEEVDFTEWQGQSGAASYAEQRQVYLGAWINENADRIHFNRYTGLAQIGGQ